MVDYTFMAAIQLAVYAGRCNCFDHFFCITCSPYRVATWKCQKCHNACSMAGLLSVVGSRR